MHHVRLVVLAHIHPDPHFRLPLELHRLHEEAAEQVVQRIAGRVVSADIGYFILFYFGCRETGIRPLAAYLRTARQFFKSKTKAAAAAFAVGARVPWQDEELGAK